MTTFRPGRFTQAEQIFAKTADESVTSSTTAQDDDHLVDMQLIAGGMYAFEGFLAFDAASDGPGIFVRLIMSQTPADTCTVKVDGVDSSGNQVNDVSATTTTNINWGLGWSGFNDSANPALHLRGVIFANGSTDGTLKLQWAQQSSSATALTLHEGSWMKLTRMS